jgi:CBS domain-containing protein
VRRVAPRVASGHTPVVDVATFLGGYPPFDALPEDRLRDVAATVSVEHFPAGETILRQEGEPARELYVVRKGAVELRDDDVLVDLLGEGDVFGQLSLLADERPSLTVRAHEDSLCYLIPADVAEEVLGTEAGRSFVIGSLRRRISSLAQFVQSDAIGPRHRAVGSLIRRPPVTCPPDTPVGVAAAEMAKHRVSSLLIPTTDGWGILTDRDLRTRIVAEGRGYDTPVGEVATFPVATLSAEATAGEALLEMFAKGVHHFPVVGGDGSFIGVVTDTDLMWLGRHTPFAIRSAIERAPSRIEAVTAARDLPEVVVALVEASADPVAIGHVAAIVVDALTRRLLDLGIAERGAAPAPWAWLALGSAARQEQSLKTDQEHALAYDVDEAASEEADVYFAGLAEFVTSGLESAGIPRCTGDAMATHPLMRRSLEAWVEAFRGWIDDVSATGSIYSSIVYDYRHVAGPLEPEPALDEVVRSARTNRGFIRRLGRRAIDRPPPTGFFRDLVVEGKGEHAGTLDVKHGGITTIGNLARLYAVRAGSVERRTLARLEAAAAAGELDPEVASELAESFRFLWEIRLRHQAAQVRAGNEPDDFVGPTTLGPVARRGLREAFRVISRAQRGLANELGVWLR